MIAAIVFKKEPFFKGDSNTDQLVKIAKVLGTDDLIKYCNKYEIKLGSEYDNVLGNYPRIPWKNFINDSNSYLSSNAYIIDLIDSLLKYDHQERLTAKEAMSHEFFIN
ncbi:unnamed protein product [[Candida] boidinii]|nr:unnamed protein product [[Candida] boidinii]